MKTRRNRAAVQRLMAGVIGFVVAALLGGCHRQMMAPVLPPVLLAPEFAPPAPDAPVMTGELPENLTTAPLVQVTEIKPRRIPRRTKSSAADATAPVDESTMEPVPEDSGIGELSAGGDSSPQTRQEASQLIISSERRLNSLPAKAAAQQATPLRRIRYFLKQAKQAFNSGDAEGAKTLATKAMLLLDDINK